MPSYQESLFNNGTIYALGQIVLQSVQIFSSGNGSVVLADGKKSLIMYLRKGLNDVHTTIEFTPNKDVILTATIPITVLIEYTGGTMEDPNPPPPPPPPPTFHHAFKFNDKRNSMYIGM